MKKHAEFRTNLSLFCTEIEPKSTAGGELGGFGWESKAPHVEITAGSPSSGDISSPWGRTTEGALMLLEKSRVVRRSGGAVVRFALAPPPHSNFPHFYSWCTSFISHRKRKEKERKRGILAVGTTEPSNVAISPLNCPSMVAAPPHWSLSCRVG